MMIVISACAPQAAATEEPGIIEEQPTPTHVNVDLTPAQRIAIAKLAENLDLTPDKIKLVSTEAVDWPDSCLGVSTEGIMCSQVVTPGFRVVLEADGKQVEYHTNQDASVIVPATVALTWSRSGGIAGFCDNLTIYLSGEVQGTSCKQGEIAEKRLNELLSREQIATMNEWLLKYGVVDIDASDPANVADAMSIKVHLAGLGTEKMTSKAVQQILLQFIQDLNQKLMNP
ncbi:MAG TPA: hypothetical protein VK909_03055 [Anaerolineales bacterium]|nr:hypothetical protein [Anaerolineales bacterium]